MMRPLVDFKKLTIKDGEDSLTNGILKYKQTKQKESALESLNDGNLD